MGTMIINPDGTVTATTSVLFTGAVDALGTGTATLTITPDGGVSTLSALLDGDPGQPANIRNVNVTMLPTGSAGSGTATQVSPGGPGVASTYDLTLSIPLGQQGNPGATGSVLNSGDISNTPADDQILSFDQPSGKGLWVVNAPVIPSWTVAGASFQAISGTNGTASGTLVTLQIPPQAFRYRPTVYGDTEITSAADTRVDTEVRMGASTQTSVQIATNGTLVAKGRGQASATTFHVHTHPYFGVAMNPTDATPPVSVPAGTAQTLVFSAVRQYGNSPWSTSQTLAEMRVRLDPV